ncbi:hypothetical protein [Flavobacterium sp. J27]|uniref:hypothetical protein n=1 Tax=Flavobacterium sp. J27 TaxID=2060419 RepID=UPI00102FCBE6|nr:hypothetical protein [Flavobacterium sp. J27]
MEHLLQFIDYKGITIFNFEKKLGIRSTIDKAIKQKSNLRGDILSKIVEVFPEINPYWLLTGKGQMLLSTEEISINKVEEPVATYGEKNAITLVKHIQLLEEQIKLQKDHIEFQKTIIEKLEKESQPIYELIQELKERIKKVEDFKEAVKLLSKVGSKVEEKEKLINRKSNPSK